MKYRYKKNHEKIPKKVAWLLLIGGIIIGTVFSFGMHYWESPVTREEAVYVEAVFSSYEKVYGRNRSLNEIEVSFQDHDSLYIDGSCCSQTVLDKMDELKQGSVLCMYVHPNSSTLLEVQDGNNSILMFSDAIENLSSEVSAFLYLGIFMYLSAVYSLIKLIRKETC